MSELTDEEWRELKAALDAVRSGTGRPLRDERLVVEGVIWRLRNGGLAPVSPDTQAVAV